MQIDRHDHIDLRIHMLLPEPFAGTADVVSEIMKVLTEIHLEDIPVCEGIQRGIQSRVWRPGLLSRQETTLGHFHQFLAERVGAALGDAGRY